MRWFPALFAVILVCAPASNAGATPPPASARSRAAEARVSERLAEEFRAKGLMLGAPVFLRITKQPGQLSLYARGADGRYALFKTYPICAFSGDLGPKTRAGDMQAPEGFYEAPAGRMNPWSSYHLSFDLGYPNAHDRALGRTGSALMVHGNCVSIGCYAMGDAAIEEIWTAMAAAFRAGQTSVKVHALPFALTEANLAAHANSPHIGFWRDLKAGEDAFARTGTPPLIRVRNKRYAVE
jgi:murein L,D-transpeptidase YafK